jgi:hypothetical protein
LTHLAKIEARQPAIPALPKGALVKPGFSDLEWSVIDLARLDGLWTIRAPGPLRRFWNWLVNRGNPQLANPRLEAIRRMAVLSWHFGFTVAGDDVADFLAAGFSADQYELMVSRIRAAAAATQRIHA